ncbi:YbhB/YbcL family Raf kinase inhibitor-like protein [Conexibacter sp. DBS9H8]|uniref:YbhB/YbcL family Raf kinase inhibitor-like protein n=1 Tax=Conexibacter sp. DBS9H8 TaxID=2937801 RepID=UPI002010A29D|nr:YbhB/YbcL family Raf kinase inhibitor-like protein [Conexibacter sp. DBS9H8]
MKKLTIAGLATILALAFATAASAAAPMRLISPAFRNGQTIPSRFTCTGKGISPPLRFVNVPRDAVALAVTVIDTTAHGFTHWTLFDIPPWVKGLAAHRVPKEAVQGTNSFGKVGYGAMCPPPNGRAHNYVFTLYALRRPIPLRRGAAPAAVKRAIRSAAFASATLRGRFGIA